MVGFISSKSARKDFFNSVNVQVGPGLLGERLDGARSMKTIEPRTIEHQPAA